MIVKPKTEAAANKTPSARSFSPRLTWVFVAVLCLVAVATAKRTQQALLNAPVHVNPDWQYFPSPQARTAYDRYGVSLHHSFGAISRGDFYTGTPPSSQTDLRKAASLLNSEQETLKAIHAGAEIPVAPHRTSPTPADINHELMPGSSENLELAYIGDAELLHLDAKLRAAQGDTAGAVRDAEDLFALADDTNTAYGTRSESIAGDFCKRATMLVAWSLGRLSRPDTASLLKHIIALEGRRASDRDALLADKRYDDWQLANLFQHPNWRQNWPDGPLPQPERTPYFVFFINTHGNRWILHDYDRTMDRLIATAGDPVLEYQSYRSQNPLVDELTNAAASFALDVRRTNPPPLLTTDLALRLYRIDNGRYPSSLSVLVAGGYIKGIPQDTYAPGTALKYRLVGDRYLLYSCGPDHQDDGGVPSSARPGSTKYDLLSPQSLLWRGPLKASEL